MRQGAQWQGAGITVQLTVTAIAPTGGQSPLITCLGGGTTVPRFLARFDTLLVVRALECEFAHQQRTKLNVCVWERFTKPPLFYALDADIAAMNATTIANRIAELEDRDALELPPLQRTVDADALVKFIESADDNAIAQFHYCGYEVTIQGNDEVTLE